MSLDENTRNKLDRAVAHHPVLLFMKGTRRGPQCGFSARVVEILDRHLPEYECVDVIENPDIREGIKVYSDWPTIPQLYVQGEFVGGADIIQEMEEAGELAELFGQLPKAATPSTASSKPTIHITDLAMQQLVAAAKDDPDGPDLHLDISALFEHALYFEKPADTDVQIYAGPINVWVDERSLPRAEGVRIDYVQSDEGAGFKVDNVLERGEPSTDAPVASQEPALETTTPNAVADGDAAAQANDFTLETSAPTFQVTPAAREQFEAALSQEQESAGPDERFGVRVGAKRMGATKFDYELAIIAENEKGANDIHVENDGIVFYMDPFSARNLQGAKIDFVQSETGSGFKFENPEATKGWDDPIAERFQRVLDDEINPGIAAHGGYVQLLDLVGDRAYVLMGGGCQGCSSAALTLQSGIAERMKEAVPEVKHIIDTTDHAAGTNPYFKG